MSIDRLIEAYEGLLMLAYRGYEGGPGYGKIPRKQGRPPTQITVRNRHAYRVLRRTDWRINRLLRDLDDWMKDFEEAQGAKPEIGCKYQSRNKGDEGAD